MPIFDNKDKKKGGPSNLDIIVENTGESNMEIEGLVPPAPDVNVDNNQITNLNVAPVQSIVIPLNEKVLEDLIKKEEENLAKKLNSKNKSLDEIKKNLNSLNSYFNNVNKKIYEDSFYANLKKEINK